MSRQKTCVVLTAAEPRAAHLRLFERLGQEFDFLIHRAVDSQDRVDSIRRASFLIVDLSGRDPGVLYGLGIAHTFGKRVFLVTDNLDTLPFDLASTRAWKIDPESDNQAIFQAMDQFLRIRQVIGPVRLFLGKSAFFGENLIGRRFAGFVIDVVLIVSLFLVSFKVFGWGELETFKVDSQHVDAKARIIDALKGD